MLTHVEAMAAMSNRVVEGTRYLWHCYGINARFMSFADRAGHEFASMTFDAKTGRVYQIDAWVPGQEGDGAWSWHDEEFVEAYLAECHERGCEPYRAWDEVMFHLVDQDTMLGYLRDISELYYDNLPEPKKESHD